MKLRGCESIALINKVGVIMFEDISEYKVPVGMQAPNFSAKALMPNGEIENEFELYEMIQDKYCVLIFYPLDYTFVCPTELLEYNKLYEKFKKLDCVLIGISIDSVYTHAAWSKSQKKDGGIGRLQYPLVSDLSKDIAHDYGVLFNEEVAFRASFIIDKSKKIRHMVVNDLPIGRDAGDTLRTLEAVIHTENYGEVCPANWRTGSKAFKPNLNDVSKYLATEFNE